VRNFLARHLPQIKLIEPQGTYLLWLDCSELKLTDVQLQKFFVEECKIGMNPGVVFGEEGTGFMRMNIGTRRAEIEKALIAIKDACSALS